MLITLPEGAAIDTGRYDRGPRAGLDYAHEMAHRWMYAALVRGARGAGQDRAAVIEVDDGLAVVRLVDLVRLPSGGLPADVSIVLCRRTR